MINKLCCGCALGDEHRMRKGERLTTDLGDLPQLVIEEELPAKETKRAIKRKGSCSRQAREGRVSRSGGSMEWSGPAYNSSSLIFINIFEIVPSTF